MSSWLMLALFFLTWYLWAVAAAAQRLADYEARQVPPERRGGVSVFPALPLFPLMAWGAALLIDRIVPPWGSRVMVAIHLVLVALFLVTTLRDLKRARSAA